MKKCPGVLVFLISNLNNLLLEKEKIESQRNTNKKCENTIAQKFISGSAAMPPDEAWPQNFPSHFSFNVKLELSYSIIG